MPDPVLLICIVIAAALYASVGFGGASGYLAVMVLFGIDPQFMRPAILCMNIFVTALVFIRLYRRGYFRAALFLPIIICSFPFAFLGGRYVTAPQLFIWLVGGSLIAAAIVMLISKPPNEVTDRPVWGLLLPASVGLGLLSGLTGVGGGIYLSPLLLFFNWANIRQSAAIASAFILINSISGLGGYISSAQPWPQGVIWLVAAAVLGGWLGSIWSTRLASTKMLKQVLVLILFVAGVRMLLSL